MRNICVLRNNFLRISLCIKVTGLGIKPFPGGWIRASAICHEIYWVGDICNQVFTFFDEIALNLNQDFASFGLFYVGYVLIQHLTVSVNV